jgi:predicted GIY-YIG superfamily endonuclease
MTYYREDQLKAGSRTKKVELIMGINPEWKDWYDKLQNMSL